MKKAGFIASRNSQATTDAILLPSGDDPGKEAARHRGQWLRKLADIITTATGSEELPDAAKTCCILPPPIIP